MRQEYAQQIQELQQIIALQNDRLQEKEANTLKFKDDKKREKVQQSEEKERHLQVIGELESNQQLMVRFETEITEVEQQQKRKSGTEDLAAAEPQLSLRDSPRTHHSPSRTVATKDAITLRWRDGNKVPHTISRGHNNTVVGGESLYLTDALYGIVHYNLNKCVWSVRPLVPEIRTECCSLAIIDNFLTTVGGFFESNVTNKLFSFTREGERKRWRELFPPMPTKRSLPIVVSTGRSLIVAGGQNETEWLNTVEVMDIRTKQWSSAAKLPEIFTEASVTICQSQIYIAGGWIQGQPKGTKSVYTCTLTDLLQSCESRSLGERLAQSLSLKARPSRSTIWCRVADLPVELSTCITLHNRLLAIGGRDSLGIPTPEVRIYHPTSDTWEVISMMNTGRSQCFAAVLPTDEIMVVGGYTNIGETDSVEIASKAANS